MLEFIFRSSPLRLHSISRWMDIWNSSIALFCSTPKPWKEPKQASMLLGVEGLWKKLKGLLEGVLK
jgi:hypothetical protein